MFVGVVVVVVAVVVVVVVVVVAIPLLLLPSSYVSGGLRLSQNGYDTNKHLFPAPLNRLLAY